MGLCTFFRRKNGRSRVTSDQKLNPEIHVARSFALCPGTRDAHQSKDAADSRLESKSSGKLAQMNSNWEHGPGQFPHCCYPSLRLEQFYPHFDVTAWERDIQLRKVQGPVLSSSDETQFTLRATHSVHCKLSVPLSSHSVLSLSSLCSHLLPLTTHTASPAAAAGAVVDVAVAVASVPGPGHEYRLSPPF